MAFTYKKLGEEFTCVDPEQLEATFEWMKLIHTIIFVILCYIEIHTPVWTFLQKRFRRSGTCCYRNRYKRQLNKKDVKTLYDYSKGLK